MPIRRRLRHLFLVLAAPAIAVARFSPARDVIDYDAHVWNERMREYAGADFVGVDPLFWLAYLIVRVPEFRSLMLYRLKRSGITWRILAVVMAVAYRPQTSLYFECSDIGPGLFVHHGFATIIAADRVGRNCVINQQVTIGWTDAGRPTLEDNVSISAAAVVIGGITLGAGTIVGAGAVVTNDTSPGSVMLGPRAQPRSATRRGP